MNLPPPDLCAVFTNTTINPMCKCGLYGYFVFLKNATIEVETLSHGTLTSTTKWGLEKVTTYTEDDSWAGGSRTIHPSGVQLNYMVDKLRVPPHHSKLWQTFYKITRRDEVRAEDIGQVWATGQLAISPAPQKCKQSEGLGRQAGPSNVTAKCPPGHTLKRGLGAPRSDHERSACKVDGVFSEVIPATCSAG